jgi:hypothetical protein
MEYTKLKLLPISKVLNLEKIEKDYIDRFNNELKLLTIVDNF